MKYFYVYIEITYLFKACVWRVSASHADQVEAKKKGIHADYDADNAVLERLSDRMNVSDSQAKSSCRRRYSVDAEQGAKDEKPVKVAVIAQAYTVADEGAMMVEALHAHVTYRAVDGAWRSVELARCAELGVVVDAFVIKLRVINIIEKLK